MTTLLKHDAAIFDDQTVYATGHAYFGCEFTRCTIVLKGFPFVFDTCKFASCIWHLDFLLHDAEQIDPLKTMLTNIIAPSIPIPDTTIADPKSGEP